MRRMIRMDDPQATILREIADKRMTRDDVAQTYAFCIRQQEVDRVDFGVINCAIVERWSASALGYVKAQAWQRNP
jgi:hypothetical protein